LVDNVAQSVPVWQPPADCPADRDSTVELRLKALDRVRIYLPLSIVICWALAGMLIGLDGIDFLSGVLLLLGATSLIRLAGFQVRWGKRLAAAKALLANVVTTRVSAEVISKKVLAVDSVHLRVNMTWADRQIVAREGEVWLAGPDAEGTAVVFVGGVPVPLPAQVVEAGERTAPEPLMNTQSALPMWFAKRHAELQRFSSAASLVVLAAVLYQFSLSYPDLWPVLAAIYLVLTLGSVSRISDILRVPYLLNAGAWQAYPVTIQAWKGKPRLFGDLGLLLSRPDGSAVPVTVRSASAELVANIEATGQLWVIGLPEEGKLTAVGVPGYPVAAAARYVANRRVHSN
jgi:hypothetical protein